MLDLPPRKLAVLAAGITLLLAAGAAALQPPTRRELAAAGAAIAAADPAVAAARLAERGAAYRRGFDLASGLFGDPALGGLGVDQPGPGARLLRDALSAAGRRGFDDAMALHLRRARAAARHGVGEADEAAARVSQYRAAHGLDPVVVDDTLMAIAAEHARRMAGAQRLEHVLRGEGSFQERLVGGGFRVSRAVENIAAGPDSVAEALELWRQSPGHERNLRAEGVDKLGIAVVRTEHGRYRTYWTLILGAERQPAEASR